jgi:hypothetical protein
VPSGVSLSMIRISPSKTPRIARTSSEGCICGSITARTVKPFDFNVGNSALSQRLVVAAWCCSSTSETISMQILLDSVAEGLRVRNALVRAMPMSVRFSTPLSLNTFGSLWIMASAWGLQRNKWKLDGCFSATAFVFAASAVMWKVVSSAMAPASRNLLMIISLSSVEGEVSATAKCSGMPPKSRASSSAKPVGTHPGITSNFG